MNYIVTIFSARAFERGSAVNLMEAFGIFKDIKEFIDKFKISRRSKHYDPVPYQKSNGLLYQILGDE
jgi:hypothetical protein